MNEEKDILKDLPKKEFLLDKREEHLVSLSLIDILYSYAYNVRSTMGENTVESAWAVNKLSGTLSWFMVSNILTNNMFYVCIVLCFYQYVLTYYRALVH